MPTGEIRSQSTASEGAFWSGGISHPLEVIGQITSEDSPESAAAERTRPRTAQSFWIPKADLVAQGYDLSLDRYMEVVHEEVAHRSPKEIIAKLAELEKEIVLGMKALETMLAEGRPAK